MWRLTISLREMRLHYGRTALTCASIVIGVAAVVAVGLANGTLRRTYEAMNKAVSGHAALEITSAGGAPFDQGIMDSVRQIAGVQAAVPLVEHPTIMYYGTGRIKLLALGIDPKSDADVRDYELVEGELFPQGQGIALEESLARSLDLKVGAPVRLLTSRGRTTTSIAGLIRPTTGNPTTHGAALFMPLRSAQRRFKAEGKIHRIQLVLGANTEVGEVRAKIAKSLPPNLNVGPPATHSPFADEMAFSLEKGMALGIGFVMLSAIFIIANTFLMNVSQRRRQLAILRTVGATRRQIRGLIFGEALLFALIGNVLGILVGIGGARALTLAMGQLFQTRLPQSEMRWSVFVIAILLGTTVSLLGAILPAWQASRLTPLEAMSVGSQGDLERIPRKLIAVGLAGFLISLGLLLASLFGWLQMYDDVLGYILVLLSSVCLIPLILRPVSALLAVCLKPWCQAEVGLARQQILRHRSRTTLTVGVLFIAASTAMGLAHSVVDNVDDVRSWRRAVLVGELFVRAAMPDMETGLSATIPEEAAEKIEHVPGILELESARFVGAKVRKPLPANASDEHASVPTVGAVAPNSSSSGDSLPKPEEQSVIAVIREFPTVDLVNFNIADFNRHDLREQLIAGQVVVGSVLAQRLGLKVGGPVELMSLSGAEPLKIAAISDDYFAGGLTLHLQKEVAQRLLGVQGVDAYSIKAVPNQLNAVTDAIGKICDEEGLILQSSLQVSGMIDRMMAGVVSSLWLLLVLGLVVAAFGVTNTLNMNVLEQSRELAVLRVVGATRAQIRRTIMAQAAMLGVIGLVPAAVLGVGLAYLMNLSTAPVTGHLVSFAFRPALWLGGPLMAMVIVLIAAWLPALRAANQGTAEALRHD